MLQVPYCSPRSEGILLKNLAAPLLPIFQWEAVILALPNKTSYEPNMITPYSQSSPIRLNNTHTSEDIVHPARLRRGEGTLAVLLSHKLASSTRPAVRQFSHDCAASRTSRTFPHGQADAHSKQWV